MCEMWMHPAYDTSVYKLEKLVQSGCRLLDQLPGIEHEFYLPFTRSGAGLRALFRVKARTYSVHAQLWHAKIQELLKWQEM